MAVIYIFNEPKHSKKDRGSVLGMTNKYMKLLLCLKLLTFNQASLVTVWKRMDWGEPGYNKCSMILAHYAVYYVNLHCWNTCKPKLIGLHKRISLALFDIWQSNINNRGQYYVYHLSFYLCEDKLA